MPETTTQTDSAPSSAEPTANETSAPIADTSSSASTARDPEPSWFTALDKALEAEKTGDTTPEEKAEAKAEEKPAETSEDSSDDETAKSMTATAGAKFKEIKAEAKLARARVAELEAKLAQFEAAPPQPDTVEVEKLQAAIAEKESKLSEYEKELAISRFEVTEEYKESVVAPMAAIIGVVEDLAKEYEISEKSLLNILEESDRKKQGQMIAEIASNFTERDRISLYNLGDDYSAVMDQRDTLRSKASEALAAREKAQQSEAARQSEENKKAWNASTKTVWEQFKAKVPLPDDAQERAKIETEVVSQVAAVDFDKLSNDHKAFAAYSGAVLPQVVKLNKALSSEIAELKSALQKYQSATPGAGSGTETRPQEIASDLGFLDALEKRFAST